MEAHNKIYFASDFHLGVKGKVPSRVREKRIVEWLSFIEKDASILYLVGDVFDYWFEYRTVVPKGFVRILGKLAQMSDDGIQIHIFRGNHDLWLENYLSEEIGATLHKDPLTVEHGGKVFHIAHGDGLGPGDRGYKFLKKIMTNKYCRFLFSLMHPSIGIEIMRYCSRKSREHGKDEETFTPSREWLVAYADEFLNKNHVDFFVFGHRHLPIDYSLRIESTKMINLGDWLWHQTYAVYDGYNLVLKEWDNS